MSILEGYDVVIDGTDNFPTRYLTNDACVMLGKTLVYGSIFRFEGQASVFNHEGGPDYRDLYPQPPPPGLVPSCAEGGVLGVLPGIIGTIQATEAIKILTGIGTTLAGRLLLFDALQMSFRELTLRRDPKRAPITELIDYVQFCGVPTAPDATGVQQVSPTTLQQRWNDGWRPYVLDVRRPAEAEIVSLPHVDRLHPHTAIRDIAAELPTDRDVLVFCRSGGRSAEAAAALVQAGHPRVHELEGGILAWVRDVDPSLPTY